MAKEPVPPLPPKIKTFDFDFKFAFSKACKQVIPTKGIEAASI